MVDENLQIEIEPEIEEDAQVEVTTTGTEPAVARTEPAADGEGDDAIADLRAQLDAKKQESESDRAARERAERDAAQARADAARDRVKAQDSEYQSVTNALTAVTAELAEAKRGYREAMEAGDFEKAADFQQTIAELAPERRHLERGKGILEERAKNPRQAVPTDPVDATIQLAAQNGQPLSARAQAWLRQHPECCSNEERNAKISWAHRAALSAGHPLDSDGYYAFLDQEMGYAKPKAKANGGAVDAEEPEAEEPAKPKAAPRKVMPAAPVSRDAGLSNGNATGTKVKLTAREAAAATDGTHTWNYDDPKGRYKKGDPIGVQEFARRKKALTEQGAYDRMTVQQ